MNLSSPIEIIKPPARFIPKLHKLGVKTLRDLLYHFPHRYENFGEVKNIADVKPNEKTTIQGKILDIKVIRTPKRRMQIVEANIQDNTDSIKAIWFNQPFLRNTLRPNTYVQLSGKIDFGKGNNFQIVSPVYEIIPKDLISLPLTEEEEDRRGCIDTIQTGGLVAIYPETEGLTSRWLRTKIKSILNLSKEVKEIIPQEVIDRQNLMPIAEALEQVHFPENENKKTLARKRLAFEELFLMQVYLKKQKKNWQTNSAQPIKFNQQLIKSFVENLPFKLTSAQKKAAWEILQDLEKNIPMNRLLEGDVGSGKTVVAMISMLQIADAGFQSALMSPTEVLAEQHYKTVVQLLPDIPIALLTNSYHEISTEEIKKLRNKEIIHSPKTPCPPLRRGERENRKNVLNQIKSGRTKIIIGTHAIIQKDVEFKNLALAIVDEQHRFGVEQRAALQKKTTNIKDETPAIIPHLLTMTATPIPRSLALSAYGDLDLSIINEMPKGRQKIITKVVAPGNRSKAYDFIKEELKKGRQVFVVCPLIEESEVIEVKSVTEEYEKLSKNDFKEFRISAMHGKMKAKEKEEIMSDFKIGKTDILISTSVIEVGIDIPNATVMIIEGADRFGLAQLHQFRGRVGRGEHQSYCLLFTDSTSRTTHQRLKALVNSNNGFELAEKDLEIRGPGEFIGARQSGIPDLAMASLTDVEMIQLAREEAENIIDKIDHFPELKNRIESFNKEVHWE